MKIAEINPFVRQMVSARMSDSRYIGKNLKSKDSRFFYIIGGRGEMIVEGVKHRLSAGTIVFFQPATEYKWIVDGSVTYAAANFDLTRDHENIRGGYGPMPEEDFIPEPFSTRLAFEDAPSLSSAIVLHGATQYEEAVLSLVRESREAGELRDDIVGAKMKYLMLSIEKMHRMGAYEADNKSAALAHEVARFIEENYARPITNRDIGEHLHFNPSYLGRVFRAEMGVSIRAYIISYRIGIAKELLATEGMPISELCAEVGFSDLPHFIKSFKRLVGTTPESYRRGLTDTRGRKR